jgi:hypothetical protein
MLLVEYKVATGISKVLDIELYTLCKSQRQIFSLRSSRKEEFILIVNIDKRTGGGRL